MCVCDCMCVCACVYMYILSLSLFIYPLLRFSFAYKHLSQLHIVNIAHTHKCEHSTYSTLVVTGIRGRGAERPVYIDLGRDSFPVFLVDLITTAIKCIKNDTTCKFNQ